MKRRANVERFTAQKIIDAEKSDLFDARLCGADDRTVFSHDRPSNHARGSCS
jgi:hypothetical protein